MQQHCDLRYECMMLCRLYAFDVLLNTKQEYLKRVREQGKQCIPNMRPTLRRACLMCVYACMHAGMYVSMQAWMQHVFE
jgi:hypothetical protein